MIPPARRLFPSDATGSIRDSGSRHRGSNPRRGAQGVSTPPACGLRHGTAYGTDDGRDERSSILSSSTTFSTPHYSPLVQPVAHRPLEPLVRGSNPRRGATPIPLRNTRSLFLFRSEGHTEPRGQSLASMDTVWRTAFRQRFFPPIFPLRRNWPIRPKERRPPQRAERDANGDYANRVGGGLQNRQMAGFDSRNRLSSDTSKTGRIHAVAHPPYPNGRNPPRADARPSVRLPRTDTVEPECGRCIPTPSRRDSSAGRAAAS